MEFLKHFEVFTKPSKEDTVLLVLDNNSSHCSLMVYNCISMFTISLHTSHRIHVTFYGPSLKAVYNSECDKFIRTHTGSQLMLMSSQIFKRNNVPKTAMTYCKS